MTAPELTFGMHLPESATRVLDLTRSDLHIDRQDRLAVTDPLYARIERTSAEQRFRRTAKLL